MGADLVKAMLVLIIGCYWLYHRIGWSIGILPGFIGLKIVWARWSEEMKRKPYVRL